MRTQPQPQNPFGHQSKGFLWEALHQRRERNLVHLDYGANNGSLLRVLSETQVIAQGVGVDVNADVVSENEKQMPPNVKLMTIPKGAALDFPDESFDSVSIISVIEHIHDQAHVLRELHRVLKKDGILVAAVPGKHLFSFLDMGNWKFFFPRVHKAFYCTWYSKDAYRQRYVECRNGLIGDVEVEKSWHQHFAPEELDALLSDCGFDVVTRDGFGFWARPLINTAFFLPPKLRPLLRGLLEWDARMFDQFELVFSAQKRPAAS